ncbi:MAG: methyl-accepting chemotaxis protein [Clostridia bacterium]|nr:methyl-accepting chemotaxis protein [Clostridia bacterium]
MKLLKNLRLSNKIFILCAILLLSFIALIEVFIIPTIEKTIELRSINKMQNLVEVPYSTMEYYYDQVRKGIVSEEKAKEMARSEINRMRYGSNDYFWINDYTPVMIMHPTKSELDGQNLSEYKDPTGFRLFSAFVDKVKESGEGVVKYQWPKPGREKPQPKMSYVKGFEPWKWIVGSGIYIDDLDEMKASVINRIHIFTLAFVILAAAMAALITIPLNRSIRKLLKHLDRLAEYDFSKLIDIDQKDEIGIISRAFNSMIMNVQALLKDVRVMGASVAESSKEVMSSTSVILKMSEQVATATSDLAKGASEQAVSSDRGKSSITEIITGLDKIAADMEKSEELAERSKETIKSGEISVRYQKEKILENKAIVINVGASITELSEKSKEIGLIVDTIRGIAAQTEMLSLNAAIEAARAGEHGRGFAIVSEEVKKLAEQSSRSVKKIQDIVKEVKASIEHTVKEVDKVRVSAADQEKAMADTVNAFWHITDTVIKITEKVKEVTAAANLLNSNAKETGTDISNIADIAENAAACTQQVAASAEEQMSVIQQISTFAEELTSLATNLQDSIHKFSV